MQLFLIAVFVIISHEFRQFSVTSFKRHRSLCRASLFLRGRSCGIDLGTTFSLVSVIEDKKPILLPVDHSLLVPSVVTYLNDGSVLVGRDAVQARLKYPENTFSSVKRIIGRTLDEAKVTGDDFFFKKNLQSYPKEITQYKRDGTMVQKIQKFCGLYCEARKKILKPEEISAEVLKKLLRAAEKYYHGEKVTNAVITVPAYFTEEQRTSTEASGYLAGLEKVQLIKEPESAAIAYGVTKDEEQLILVIDLGGGTFDVSVLEIGDGLIEVIGTSGDG
jgi:molecular chaperone DnaK